MSEVKEREELSQTQTAETPAVQAAENAPAKVPLKEKWKAMPRKKRRRIVRLGILLLVLALVGGGVYKLLGGKQEGENQIITDVVHYGSITSVVDGSGLTRAKSSETITLTTAGTVLDVLVAEGDVVTAGTPLFTIDSPAAETAVQKARSNLEGYQKQLNQAEKDIAGLNLSAGYPGKLLETVTQQGAEGGGAGGRPPPAPDPVLQLCLFRGAVRRPDRGRVRSGADEHDPRPDRGSAYGQPHHLRGV